MQVHCSNAWSAHMAACDTFSVLQVLPTLGAEQCLEFCGGLAAMLAAVGIDMAQACAEPAQLEQAQASESQDDDADGCAC